MVLRWQQKRRRGGERGIGNVKERHTLACVMSFGCYHVASKHTCTHTTFNRLHFGAQCNANDCRHCGCANITEVCPRMRHIHRILLQACPITDKSTAKPTRGQATVLPLNRKKKPQQRPKCICSFRLVPRCMCHRARDIKASSVALPSQHYGHITAR